MEWNYKKKCRDLINALERSAMNNHIARHSHTGISPKNWRQCKEPSCVDAFTALTTDLELVELL